MNPIKRFFQEDIPAVFSAGKWRVSLMQLNTRLSQLEKQKNAALKELGDKAWESKVKDERYTAVYSKLEELDVQLAQTQREIDSRQDEISGEMEHLNSTNLESNSRLQTTQNQRQAALQKLSQLQASQKSIELRISQLQATVNQGVANVQNLQTQMTQFLGSNQPDKDEKIVSLQSTIATVQTQINDANTQVEKAKPELVSNLSEQSPIKSEVDGYDQLISMMQEKNRSAVSAIQENLKRLQQDLLKLNEKKTGLSSQISALTPDLGNQVYKYRPTSDALLASYGKVDAINSEIKSVNDQINLTQARMASVSRGSYVKVASVAVVAISLVACIAVFIAVVFPAISNALKPDPRDDIKLVENWTLENCSAFGSSTDFLDVAVWENNRNDATADVKINAKLLGSEDVILDSASNDLEIAPRGLAVAIQELDSQGSRVQEVTHSVSSAVFSDTNLVDLRNVDVETFFEKTRSSDNVTLSLEITNGSDFGLQTTDISYAFVVDQQNNLIDILIGDLNSATIPVDAFSKITFQSMNFFGSISCLQSEYSQQTVTFWYFVPLELATNSRDQLTLSDKVVYSP